MATAKSLLSSMKRDAISSEFMHRIRKMDRGFCRCYSSTPRFTPFPYHSSLIKSGSIHTPHVATYLLKLYLKNSDLSSAQKLFDEMPERDVRTWTVLISGLSKCGHARIALNYFSAMLNEGTVAPNAFTLSSVIKCCASVRDGFRIGKTVHAWTVVSGVDVDVALGNAVLDFYVKSRAFDCAARVFDSMDGRNSDSWNIVMAAKFSEGKIEEALDLFSRSPEKTVSSWNTIINGVLRQGLEEKAVQLLYEMVKSGYVFNEVTFSTSLVLASSTKNSEHGRQIHGLLLRTGMSEDPFVSTSLLDMYCKCRKMQKAAVIFHDLQLRCKGGEYDIMAQTITWSTMIAGCVHNGRRDEALRYFRSMILNKLEMDLFTLTTIVTASADDALLELGQQVHAHTLKLGYERDVFLRSAVIDMYAKCGKLDDSWTYFREIRIRNTVLWTTMISSYAMHGLGNEAVELFELMRNEGMKPTEVSFLGILTACSHAGLVEEGCKFFKMMTDVYGILPCIEHFSCMIDLLGRAGHLNEIKDFVYENGIDHLREVWRTYLSSCWLHKNVEMTNWVSKKLLELDPHQPDPYLLSSNIYAANEIWEDAAKARGLTHEMEVRKLPAQSWI